MAPCVHCGSEVSAAPCPACGAEQPHGGAHDPLLGKVLADRYEIVEPLTSGGMAKLYRGVQRSLDRAVVVKVIDPRLLSADEDTANEAVSRFMVEARAASRINHPNVISVFDFGRTQPGLGGHLFMVMELLKGPDLWTLLAETPHLPLPRIASILRQTLAALGEAHSLGIVHRDVKPENIIVEQRFGGADHVKVIDFGIAKLEAAQSLTQAGRALGTPHYMAPEQVEGSAVGSADLYAIGILLFQMLTGQVPFDGDSPLEILMQHLHAPRPDPRAVAPERRIPDALAELCVRSMAVDPAQRFSTAEALAEALAAAMPPAPRVAPSVPPRQIPRPSIAPGATPGSVARPSALAAAPAHRAPAAGSEPPPPRVTLPFFGRDAEMTAARQLLADPRGAGATLFCGRIGVGRSRLLHEIAKMAVAASIRAVEVSAPPSPLTEAGYGALRRVISRLANVPAADPRLASGEAASDPGAARGLRVVFGGELPRGADGEAVRASAAAALAWAAHQALAGGQRCLLALDDVHRYDGASWQALRAVLEAPPIPGLLVWMTSTDRPPAGSPGAVAVRPLEGLSPRPPARQPRAHAPDAAASSSRGDGADTEPLALELTRRWRLEGRAGGTGVNALVAAKLAELPPPQRRALQAIALTGGGSLETLARVLPIPEPLEEPVRRLADHGIAGLEQGVTGLTHDVFGRVAIATAPAGVLSEVHARIADALGDGAGRTELRAYHALRGSPDFEAFMLAEESARLRAARGDEDGAITMLSEAMRAGRTLLLRGEVEAAGSACLVFSKKLGAALLAAGRLDEADGVLEETLELCGRNDPSRADALEMLGEVAERRSRPELARQRRVVALAIAHAQRDEVRVARLERVLTRA